jgi:hypothetical protein
LQAMFITKLRFIAGVMLLAGALVAGAWLIGQPRAGSHPEGELIRPADASSDGAVATAPVRPASLPTSQPARDQSPSSEDPDWGTIKGQIVYVGDRLPEAVELKVDKDQEHCLEKGKLFGQEWVVNKDNKGIRWVFVWLAHEPSAAKKDMPIHPSLKEIKEKKVTIDQPCCAFEPHALAVREGQIVVAKNGSPIAHNFNYAGHPLVNQGKNQLMPPKSEFEIDNLRADERFPVMVSCNIHPWMRAYVRVFNHPYFAVTNEKGEFEIKNAPAGEWRLKIWHDSGWRGGAMGRDGEKITVKGGAATDLGKLEMKPQ